MAQLQGYSRLAIPGLGLIVVLALALNTLVAGPASAMAAVGASRTTGVGGRSVSGAGTFALQPIPGSTRGLVSLECTVSAEPAHQVVSTFVDTPANGGCVLYKGTTPLASALGSSRNTPAWATTSATEVDLSVAGAFQVCWRVGARFDDTSEVTNSDCGTSAVPSNVHSLSVSVSAAERNGVVTVACQAIAKPDGFVTSIRECNNATPVSNPGPFAATTRTYAMRTENEPIDITPPTPIADVSEITEMTEINGWLRDPPPVNKDIEAYSTVRVCYSADSLFVDGIWLAKQDCVTVGLNSSL